MVIHPLAELAFKLSGAQGVLGTPHAPYCQGEQYLVNLGQLFGQNKTSWTIFQTFRPVLGHYSRDCPVIRWYNRTKILDDRGDRLSSGETGLESAGASG